MTDNIFESIGKLMIYGGSLIAINLGLLKWFGQKWFENQFSQKLEKYKRKQTEVLEQFRYQINIQLSRITKIHEKEFEVLPNIWYKLQDTYDGFLSLSAPIKQLPDLNNYNEQQLENFIRNCELLDYQKEELKDVNDKLKYYEDKVYWIRLFEAKKNLNDLRKYLRYNKIFLSKDLYKLFSDVEFTLIEAETELEQINQNFQIKQKYEIFKKLKINTEKYFLKIENSVQKRLHFEDK